MSKSCFVNPSNKEPPIEDNLNILKVEYISNQLLDHIQILNISYVEKKYILNILKIKQQPHISGISHKPLIGPYINFKLMLG